jgi:hypothetical protein
MCGIEGNNPARWRRMGVVESIRRRSSSCSRDKRIISTRRSAYHFLVIAAATFLVIAISARANAGTAEDLHRDADRALQILYRHNPVAETISKRARAVLVLPKVIKAGLVFDVIYGEGVLMKGSHVVGYYNSGPRGNHRATRGDENQQKPAPTVRQKGDATRASDPGSQGSPASVPCASVARCHASVRRLVRVASFRTLPNFPLRLEPVLYI